DQPRNRQALPIPLPLVGRVRGGVARDAPPVPHGTTPTPARPQGGREKQGSHCAADDADGRREGRPSRTLLEPLRLLASAADADAEPTAEPSEPDRWCDRGRRRRRGVVDRRTLEGAALRRGGGALTWLGLGLLGTPRLGDLLDHATAVLLDLATLAVERADALVLGLELGDQALADLDLVRGYTALDEITLDRVAGRVVELAVIVAGKAADAAQLSLRRAHQLRGIHELGRRYEARLRRLDRRGRNRRQHQRAQPLAAELALETHQFLATERAAPLQAGQPLLVALAGLVHLAL